VTAIPQEVLGLRVEVVRSIRRTASLHIVGSDLQVRIPEHLGDKRVAAIPNQKRPWIRGKVAELKRVPRIAARNWSVGSPSLIWGATTASRSKMVIRWGCASQGDTSRQRSDQPSRVSNGKHESSSTSSPGIGPLPWNASRRRPPATPSRSGCLLQGCPFGTSDLVGGPATSLVSWSLTGTSLSPPHSIVDYVVIHELCHILYPNHSKDFWQLVGRHDQLFAAHKNWLKTNSRNLLTNA
jgi:hypothetical protein